MKKKVLVIGGVAGGASFAARARRVSEDSEIIMLDRGPHVSFANCGLPYYVGKVITDESKLLVATPELFKQRFNIEVRLRHEVLKIDRTEKTIEVRDLETGRVYNESYDALVLAPGAAPIRPPLPGIDLEGIFALRTIPDSRRILKWISDKKVKKAAIVGGGFIGLEMAENLSKEGIQVSIVEMLPQVMPPFDPEMVEPVHQHLRDKGVTLYLGDAVSKFEQSASGGLVVSTKSGRQIESELVILSIGVRPETKLAVDAGIKLGERGGIKTDDQMRTSDPNIWAVGDAVEVRDVITGQYTLIPLAGPANRQGRVAADAVFGLPSFFRGVQATAVCGIFDYTVAMTGASEKTLKRAAIPFEKIYLHPGHHAGYYPDAQPIDIKLLFDPESGRILGAQAVGEQGVEKRIDVIAMAIQKQGTVYDLEEAELSYAPQFGAAKDPVNIAGMIAANALRMSAPVISWEKALESRVFLLDVRTPEEYAAGHVEEAVNIPLNEIRTRSGELPKDKPIGVYCQVGQRGYYAVRILCQKGFQAFNLTGGYKTFLAVSPKLAAVT